MKMCLKTLWVAAAAALVLAIWTPAPAQNNQAVGRSNVTADDGSIGTNALKMIDEGRRTFRFETFGDKTFWGECVHFNIEIEDQPVRPKPLRSLSPVWVVL